jgi:molybdenum cofactor guanylyltransferase
VILGVVLAGGQSTRFGSDKALAMLGGVSLLDRAVASLARWCSDVVIVGRETGPAPCIPDWPRAGLGPLGGIAAGLLHARQHGHASVLTCGVDSVDLPADLPALLDQPPACLASQPVIGHWPVSALEAVEAILEGQGRHSLKQLIAAVSARTVSISAEPANINTPADLAATEQNHGI